jgi:hypothetical protein
MKALNHYISLAVVCMASGYFVGLTIERPYSMVVAIGLGIVLGFNWHRVTGYTIGENEGESK